MNLKLSSIALVAALSLMVSDSALAAAPQVVTQQGAKVTTAVPGKPFQMKFKVTNTGTTEYSGVRVIFHIPEGLSHSKVAPANATIQDDIVSWSNVPIGPGKSFYPSFTFTMALGTPLKTKLPIWVEVTGEDMEATSTNFSATAVKMVTPTTPAQTSKTLTQADISTLFQFVYGRTPTASELTYWLGRRTDKPGKGHLLGAIQYHRAMNIAH